MKHLALAILLAVSLNQPAHAGIIHRAAKIASVPLWIVGWSAACVGGFVAIPLHRGAAYFCNRPFVKF